MYVSDLLDRIPLGIMIFDESNEIISINDWGNEFINKTSSYLLEVIKDIVTITLAEQKSNQKVVRCCDHNQFFIWNIRTEIIQSPSLRIVVIIEDKTSHSKLEQIILKAEKLSVIGYLAIGSLMEIRNPLTSAMGFCRLIQEGEDVNKEYFDIISKELEEIHDIIESYADMSEPVATRCIESIYHKFWALIHSKIRSYRLIMITDSRDDSLIGYTPEDQISSMLRFISSLKLWTEESIYIVSIEFKRESRSLKLDFASINGFNDYGKSNILNNTVNRYKMENHQINVQIINNEEADIGLNFDAI